ncbi:response regulator transcription factor [bacterium]|nr:response regulator transcription factor [bacterium]
MFKTVILYGIAMAALIALLKFIEYRFFVRDFTLEIYIGAVAVIFSFIGVWAGRRLTRVKVILARPDFTCDEKALQKLDISKREYEILELIAQGLSNQEIADRLYVSINTIKTHSSNLFMKLDARRRTQAIQRAKELRILP